MAPLFDIHIASMPQTDLHFVLNIVGIANLDMFGPLVVDNLQQWLTLSTLALDVKAKHTGLYHRQMAVRLSSQTFPRLLLHKLSVRFLEARKRYELQQDSWRRIFSLSVSVLYLSRANFIHNPFCDDWEQTK